MCAFVFVLVRRGELHVAEFGIARSAMGRNGGDNGEALIAALCAAAAASLGTSEQNAGLDLSAQSAVRRGAAATTATGAAGAALAGSATEALTVICPAAPLMMLRRLEGRLERDGGDDESLIDGGWLFRANPMNSRASHALQALQASENFVFWRADSF